MTSILSHRANQYDPKIDTEIEWNAEYVEK